MKKQKKWPYFVAGMISYAAISLMTKSPNRVYTQNNQQYLRLNGQTYPILNNQVGTIEHRIRGILDESPAVVRQTIEKLLQEP